LGGGLTKTERNNMLDFDCDTIVKSNSNFGPDVLGVPNYALLIGKCPANCDTEGNTKVMGVAIHPAASGICKSAIYDQSMPFHGGIIGVGITPGLKKYSSGRTIMGIKAIAFGESTKSFYTMKIDNVDMVRNNMRIVD